MNGKKNSNIAIIGAGVSGLRLAHLLAKEAPNTLTKMTLFDKDSSVGGVLKSTFINDFRLEHGAQGVLLSRESFLKCVQDLKIENQVLLPNKKEQRRYIMTENTCIPLTPNVLKLKTSGLLDFKDLFRILFEFFVKKPIKPILNETLFAFFERRFGKNFANTFLVSLSFGIWGGGSRKMLVRYTFPKLQTIENGYGSLIKSAFILFFKNIFHKKQTKTPKGLASFSDGMSFLTTSLFKELEKECLKQNIELVVNLNSTVSSIKKEEKLITIKYQKENQNNAETFDSVIYSGQPWRDLNLNIEVGGETSTNNEFLNSLEQLRKIESHSVTVVGLGAKQTSMDENSIKGFGALAGEWSKDILGVIFVHSTYPSHAPKNSKLYRVLLGGDRDPFINSKSQEEIIALSKLRLVESKVTPANIQFDFSQVIKWDNYIPLATINQDKVIEAIWKIEALLPGFFLTGNYIKGPSIADCLDQAEVVSKNVILYLNTLDSKS